MYSGSLSRLYIPYCLLFGIIFTTLFSCANHTNAHKEIRNTNQSKKYVPSASVKYKNNYKSNHRFRKFFKQAVSEHKFTSTELDRLFSQIKNRPDIIKLMNRQAEDLPWYKYKKIFLNKKRIRGGVKFWNKNARLLAKAEKKYGVPAEIIVAIIGVETRYGAHKGRSQIIESLSTLAFDYPRRADYFQKELIQFLTLCREQKFKPLAVKGSFAGAMGMPQFMPSSYRRYAVDFDNDGKKDLFHSNADIIGSVANYFHVFGWQPGEAVVTRAKIRGRQYRKLPKPKLRPYLTLGQFATHRVTPRKNPNRWDKSRKAALLTLQQKGYKEYWFGFQNFYVITRYNHSTHYAMAVYRLSQMIKRSRKRSQ